MMDDKTTGPAAWYWRAGHGDWVQHAEIDSAEIEEVYKQWMKLGGQRSRKNKFVRMVIDDDHEICFGDMQ